MAFEAEGWRDIPDYEGLYQVSNLGSVMRLAGSEKCLTNRLLKPKPNQRGYCRVTLSRDMIYSTRYIHHLVMEAFVGPRPKSFEINHLNGIKSDNRLANLEYCTAQANREHLYEVLGYKDTGESAPSHKLNETDVRRIRNLILNGQQSHSQIARLFNVNRATIGQIARHETWKNI